MSKASETITENIFRQFYGTTTFIEKSAIDKKYGFISKNKTEEEGYPDFFIDLNDYVIVVETKKANTCHNAAIADVKWYMSNNQIEHQDIIGIALSGQAKDKLRINYFLKIQGKDMEEIGGNDVLLSLHNIEKLYRKKKYGDTISDTSLTNFLKQLNEKFHSKVKIRDTDRSLFFSGLMIALNDVNFRNTYNLCAKPEKGISAENLNRSILTAISLQLENKVNNYSKTIGWRDRFSFINTIDFELDDYKKMIKDIEKKIFIPFKNEEKLDILGKAYKIFLSRAGKIENKNIILTPDHIKALMIKLAELNIDDVVIDTCTGSGGFLMEAMETLINLANGNDEKIAHIKARQLIGFENDSVLFPLTCSNMFLHGDGRTNLLYRSSLLGETEEDNEVLEYIQNLKPTKCIINPPYEVNSAIKFTCQAIEFLEQNGRLIIIMPSNTLEKKENLNSVKALFEKASLDFVIKMPEHLFREQGRTIQTSIFGFTKKPHNHNKEVLFYRLLDDGFETVQRVGRKDLNNCWHKLEDEILNCCLNNISIENVSYRQKIFNCGEISFENHTNISKNLFKIEQLFNVETDPLKLQSTKNTEGEYIFITGSADWKTHNKYSYNCEALVYVVGAEGSLGRCHYVNGKFVASSLCLVLTPKDNNKYPLNLEYYKLYFDNIRTIIVSELKSGASKKTISKPAFQNYYIPYIDINIQNSVVRNVNANKRKLLQLKEHEERIEKDINILISQSIGGNVIQ